MQNLSFQEYIFLPFYFVFENETKQRRKRNAPTRKLLHNIASLIYLRALLMKPFRLGLALSPRLARRTLSMWKQLRVVQNCLHSKLFLWSFNLRWLFYLTSYAGAPEPIDVETLPGGSEELFRSFNGRVFNEQSNRNKTKLTLNVLKFTWFHGLLEFEINCNDRSKFGKMGQVYSVVKCNCEPIFSKFKYTVSIQ